MILFVAGALAVVSPAEAQDALELCRPKLVRKTGEVQDLAATSIERSGRTLRLKGQFTAAIGMRPPPPGSASAHHLIRTDFEFECRIRDGVARHVSIRARS